jgi:hypothetical protein
MLAFAANSLLCRLALARGGIDPASFGAVRVVSGAVALALIVRWRAGAGACTSAGTGGDWLSAAMLFGYVAFFSFAYVSLPAGTGALILFGAVQLTMFGWALRRGERFTVPAWCGLALAAVGLVYLVLPGVSAPPLVGAVCMALAGAAWGAYSLRGRGRPDPLRATAGNFLRAAPMALVLWLPFAGACACGRGGRRARGRVWRADFGRRLCAVVHGAARTHRDAGGDGAVVCAPDHRLRRGTVPGRAGVAAAGSGLGGDPGRHRAGAGAAHPT